MIRALMLAGLGVALASCSNQSRTTSMPIGVSKSINGLQRSPCATSAKGKPDCYEVELPGNGANNS